MVVRFPFTAPYGDGMARRLAVAGAPAILAASICSAQIDDPIAEPIENRGLRVELTDVARLPDSRTKHPPERDVDPNA